MSPADREAALKTMEAGKAEFADVSGKQFFEALLQSAMEGFFADPIYGGNRDKVSWRMIGYPGLPAAYADKALEYRGKKVVIEPQVNRRLFLRSTIMAKTMKAVDAVMVGMGWSGSIMARELTKAGLTVVGLERGADRSPREDFALPRIRDELKYRLRYELMLDTAVETHTFRNSPSELALPMRRWEVPPLGDGVGGAGAHWNGITWRFSPSEFVLRSHLTARYGRNAIPEDMTIQDWGVTYDDLEPHYDRFEKLCGTSGKAGNLRGQKIEGGNVFEGPRGNDYPNKPLIMSQAGLIFTKAAQSLGYHPFPTPASNSSAPYTNPEGMTIGQCQYCGHCEFFGCEANAKASPLVCILPALLQDKKFELRSQAYVSRLVYDRPAKKVRGVVYIDRRTGEEIEQPADLVVLCAYPFNNTLLLLTAGIGEPYDPVTGKGVVGKNYCQQTNSSVTLFVDDEINPFIGTGIVARRDRRFPGRQFRSRRPGLLRRRLHLAGGQRREADPGPRRASRHAALGLGMEGGDRALVQPLLPDHHARHQLRAPQPLSRSRSDLQGRDRPAAGAHDLQLHRQRLQDVGVSHRKGHGDRPCRQCQDRRQSAAAPGQFRHQQRPVLASHRRRDHGNRSDDQRDQSLSAVLGREQPVRHGRRRLPAECRPQSDRNDRRADLLVGEGDHVAISEITGPACPGIAAASDD